MELSTIQFGTTQTTVCIPVDLHECSDLPYALSCESRPVISLVGNISIESPEYRQACRVLLEQCVFPLAERCGAVLLSTGFSLHDPSKKNDLPWLIDQVAAGFPSVTLIGVNLDCEAALPWKVEAEPWRGQALCEHHTAYVLAPGLNQRDACVWRTTLASAITGATLPFGRVQPGVTLVFGGTAMKWFDVLGSIEEGRQVIAVTYPGVIGVSTAIANLLAGGPPQRTFMADLNKRLEAEAAGMVTSGRLFALPGDDPLLLFDRLATLLLCPDGVLTPG